MQEAQGGRAWLLDLTARHPELDECVADIDAAYRLLEACYSGGGQVLVCGNGGSAADCEHLVGELMKGFVTRRPLPDEVAQEFAQTHPDGGRELAGRLQGALPAISLVSQTGIATAIANDMGGDLVFAQQVYGYGRPGGVLIAISTSGNSENVLAALRVARVLRMGTIGFTGREGGAMVDLCDVAIRVPHDETGRIQELHLPIYHTLCGMLEDTFFAAPQEER